jgi:hypothetical protein
MAPGVIAGAAAIDQHVMLAPQQDQQQVAE